MQIYSGKSAESGSSAGLCSRVMELMDGLDHWGYNLYTDNYYTSPDLYSELYKKGIHACGTLRVNRKGFPKDLVHTRKDVERGFYD